ncbi:MAG: polyphenol oxidase family protein [Ilumatobacteraceae bacterium]
MHVRTSTVADGDFHLEVDPRVLHHRRQAFMDGPWTQLDEVHGTDVVVVTRPGEHDRAVADAAVTRVPGAVLSVWVGDCAPVVLLGDSDDGRPVVAGAHAGWKGALDGVLERTVSAMHATGTVAVLGPCIHGCCNEFGADLLARFVDRFGPQVAATTTWGTPSLHLPAVVRAALDAAGVDEVIEATACTRCDERWFSHRRGDAGRHVMCVRMMEAR